MLNIDGASYLDMREAVERLGVKPETLYAYVSRGMLRSYKQGIRRRRLYLQREIEALLALRPPVAGTPDRGEADGGGTVAQAGGPAASVPTGDLPRADGWATER